MMKFYALALKKIFISWYMGVTVILDIIAILIVFYSQLQLPLVVYASILILGFLISCMTTVAQQLRELDNSSPLVVSNDNLSLGGPDISVDNISLINIGGDIAKVTNISSDEAGRFRIIDDHYMESFFLQPGALPLNVMIREAKIIDGWGTNIAPSTIVRDWKKPFFIFIWFESKSGKHKFCNKVEFQSGDKFVRNLGW